MTTLLRDRYAVGDMIGAGGAARVHVATDQLLGRRVAVKVLDDGVARTADPAGRARFLAEVRTAATITHPNLVAVYDAGEDDGELFLVMEYVEGVTLAELLARRGALPAAEALSITRQVLDGLAAVHAQGTIHRDVKPANILVGDDGRVRLADFGIAKRLDEIGESVTATGTLVGSPGYLAPEQSAGRPLSAATDVFQAGVVLAEMLTGRRATPGGNGVTLGVPAGLAAVVARATDPDPSARYASASDMRAALDAGGGAVPQTLVMPVEPVTTVLQAAAPPDRRPALLAAVAVAIAVLVIALAAVAARGGDDPELLPGPTTVPVIPTTAAPAPTVAATIPAAPAPSVPRTEPEPRDDGKGNDKEGKGPNKDRGDRDR